MGKYQIENKGYCTSCVKTKTTIKQFNHYTGKLCAPGECFNVPDSMRSYKIKDNRQNVIVSFRD